MGQITTDQLNTLATQFLAMGNAMLSFRENTPGIAGEDDAVLELASK